jgi:hypothetical protein
MWGGSASPRPTGPFKAERVGMQASSVGEEKPQSL